MSLPLGTVLNVGAVIQHFVGAGPTGEVYAADRRGHMVAVKLLAPDLAADPTFLERLTRLHSHLAKVGHPAVARALGQGEHAGRPVLVRELVPGRSASDLVLHTGPLPPARALALALSAAEALTEAHRSGALHLNLKPSNLFVLENDQVKLVDFGVAQRLALGRSVVYGDPRYLAPEQFDGKLVSFRSDIYGLGGLLYFLLTGQPPHQGDPLSFVGPPTSEPVPPSSLIPALGRTTRVDGLVLRAVEAAPSKRYLSVQHFARVMEGLLEELQSATGVVPSRRPAQTLRMGEVMPRSGGYGSEPLPPLADGDATVRTVLPPDDHKATRPMPYAVGQRRDTVPQPAVRSDMGGYRPPPPGRDDHDTIRVPAAPHHRRAPQPQAMPPTPSFGDAPGGGVDYLDDIDIVTVEPTPPPPKKRKKKRKKKKDPIIAVRAEAAFRRTPAGHPIIDDDDGDSVLIEDQFRDEARGHQRNVETMEIRIHQPVEDPEESGGRRELGKFGRYALAAGALLLLFVLAALGAAALAHWLSSPGQPAPPEETPIESPQNPTAP